MVAGEHVELNLLSEKNASPVSGTPLAYFPVILLSPLLAEAGVNNAKIR